MKFYSNGQSQVTKVAAMFIYVKTLAFFSRVTETIALKFGIYDLGYWYFETYINSDRGLTFTYFTSRSNLVSYTFE